MSDSNAALTPPPRLSGWMAEIQERLAGRARPTGIEPGEHTRAAVLVPLFVRDGQLWVLFTLRTETVEHHRGQISFPGGGVEPQDRSLADTALRESEEEIGLARSDAILLGTLSPIVTVTNFYVEPFVAAIPQPYVFQPQETEIAELVEVPVGTLLDPRVREERTLPGREGPVLFYHYGKHMIWGATARILAEFLDALRGGIDGYACNPDPPGAV